MSNPYMVVIPFCNTGNKNTIQITRQPSQDPEDATYQEGFPPETMLNQDAGGLPPKGLDFNGIFYELSSPIAHYCRGDRIQFDATYAAAIGGYAKGAIVASNDYQKDYISLVDNNLADPNGTNTTWSVYAGQGSVPLATSTTTGTVKLVNNLLSTATDAALTAAQGKVLSDIFDRFVFSANQDGYAKIPFGSMNLVVQWGVLSHGDVSFTTNFPIVFPIPFPVAVFSVVANEGGNQPCVINVINKTRTGFTAAVTELNQNVQTGNVNWIAIGY